MFPRQSSGLIFEESHLPGPHLGAGRPLVLVTALETAVGNRWDWRGPVVSRVSNLGIEFLGRSACAQIGDHGICAEDLELPTAVATVFARPGSKFICPRILNPCSLFSVGAGSSQGSNE